MCAVMLSGKINVFNQLNVNNALLLSNILLQSHPKSGNAVSQSCLVGMSSPITLAAVLRVALGSACGDAHRKSCLCGGRKVFAPQKLRVVPVYPTAPPTSTISVSSPTLPQQTSLPQDTFMKGTTCRKGWWFHGHLN